MSNANDEIMNSDVMTEENLNEILRIRREKLKKLKEENRDPFEITKYSDRKSTRLNSSHTS